MQQTPSTPSQKFVIRITDSSLSFAMRNGKDNNLAFESYEMKKEMSVAANLRQAFRESNLLSMAGQKVTVTIDSKVIIVPIEEFEEKDIEEQYHYVYPNSEGMTVVSTVLPTVNSIAIYAISKDIRTVLCDHFEEVRIMPLMAMMWDFLMQRSYGGTNKKIYAYFHDGMMEVCSFTRNRFRFNNTFCITDSHDALYFLLGVWKTIGGKAMTDDLFLLGKIPARDSLTEETKQFLSRVYYINPSADFNRADFSIVEGIPFDMMVLFR